MTNVTPAQPLRRAKTDILDDCFGFHDFDNPTREHFRHGKTTYTLVQSLPKPSYLEYDISPATIQHLTASLHTADGKRVAYFKAAAYRLKGCSAPRFVESCDAFSQSVFDMAEVLDECFVLGDLPTRSIIVSIDRIAIHPAHAGKRLMTALMKQLLPQLTKKPTIAILKAFPLECEGTGDKPSPDFHALQAGLIDYYGRTLGMAPLPGSYGKEGWLYLATVSPDPMADLS